MINRSPVLKTLLILGLVGLVSCARLSDPFPTPALGGEPGGASPETGAYPAAGSGDSEGGISSSTASGGPYPPTGTGGEAEGPVRGEAFVTERELLMTGTPPQPVLSLVGNLPTPCHELQVRISEPDAAKRLFVEVFSLVDPNQNCIQVLHPFEEQILIENLPAGDYSVWLDGKEIGSFSLVENQAGYP